MKTFSDTLLPLPHKKLIFEMNILLSTAALLVITLCAKDIAMLSFSIVLRFKEEIFVKGVTFFLKNKILVLKIKN